jgi:hypothetical protein
MQVDGHLVKSLPPAKFKGGDNMERTAKYVQGDVFLEPIKEMPAGVVRASADRRGVVLAEGEATGHAHTIDSPDAVLYEDRNRGLYLAVSNEVSVVHQEHLPVRVPTGTYKVGIVQEYDYFNEEARKVVD